MVIISGHILTGKFLFFLRYSLPLLISVVWATAIAVVLVFILNTGAAWQGGSAVPERVVGWMRGVTYYTAKIPPALRNTNSVMWFP